MKTKKAEKRLKNKKVSRGKKLTAPRGFTKGKWSKPAQKVLRERYLQKDERGRVIETPEGMVYRVAKEAARAEKGYGTSSKEQERVTGEFYSMIIKKYFVPNSPTLMNAGKGNGLQYSACFVLPVGDSMEGIFEAVKRAAIIHKSGGGTGFSFSRLRPQGMVVGATRGVASGPISFMRIFDSATNEIKQGGMRRGANMGILRVDHPDIMEFIKCKLEGGITNFNISVGVTDEFIKAVEKGGRYWLKAEEGWPDGVGGHYKKGARIKQISARKVFKAIVAAAHRSGDPGLIFLDQINKSSGNPVPVMGPVEATNPCGEQPLYPNEACNLGSMNLGLMVKGGGVDWEKLKQTTRLAVRFLDDIIDVNPFPLKEITKTVKANRRIGLGVMGWADLLFKLKIPYDSREAVTLARKVMRFINKEGHLASSELAKKRGVFPNFKKSIYKDGPPMRNATVTTIAPTGSISLIGGCSSGIEPVFALAFLHQSGKRKLKVVNSAFQKAISGLKHSQEILDWACEHGSLKGAPRVSAKTKRIFVTAHEIDWRWHIRTQAAFQAYVDNAVSKTINMPTEASVKDVRDAYLLAYKLGCRGITVFRDGCKGEQVLTAGTKKEEEKKKEGATGTDRPVKERPLAVQGFTYRVKTPAGTAFVTINHNGKIDHPMEVFVNVGRAGSELAADAEAIGRLISLCLRINSPHMTSRQIADLVVDQLRGIGGGSTIGFGKDKVRSLADGVAKAIEEHVMENNQKVGAISLTGHQPALVKEEKRVGRARDICPKCGDAGLIYEEGCARCLSCSFSKC